MDKKIAIVLIHTKFQLFNYKTWFQLFNKEYWNNVGILNGDFIYESTDNGVIKTHIKKRLKTDQYFILNPKFRVLIQSIDDTCDKYLEKNYGLLNTMFFKFMYRFFNIWIGKQTMTGERRLYNSEFVALAFFNATLGKMYKNWYKITPQVFYQQYESGLYFTNKKE